MRLLRESAGDFVLRLLPRFQQFRLLKPQLQSRRRVDVRRCQRRSQWSNLSDVKSESPRKNVWVEFLIWFMISGLALQQKMWESVCFNTERDLSVTSWGQNKSKNSSKSLSQPLTTLDVSGRKCSNGHNRSH